MRESSGFFIEVLELSNLSDSSREIVRREELKSSLG